MKTKLRFYKTNEGRWYADLPEYLDKKMGTLADLEMVSGADEWLDKLSNGTDSVTLALSDTEALANSIVHKGDGVYIAEMYDGKYVNHKLWLCPVTLFVFNGHYPNRIYYTVILTAKQAALIAKPVEVPLEEMMWKINLWANRGENKVSIILSTHYVTPETEKALEELGYKCFITYGLDKKPEMFNVSWAAADVATIL